MAKNYLFTSESVSEGHPDKVADQISDAILDEFLKQDPEAKVACESFCSTGMVVVMGEVKAVGRTFEEALQKGLRMIGQGMHGFVENHEIKIPDIAKSLHEPTDMRIFVVSKALKIGYTIEQIHQLTMIDRWFLEKLKHIVDIDQQLKENALLSEVSEYMEPSEFMEYLRSPEIFPLLRAAKIYGFSDFQIGRAIGLENRMKMERLRVGGVTPGMQAGLTVRKWRKSLGIVPTVNQIDTLAAEYPAQTNYLYLSYL